MEVLLETVSIGANPEGSGALPFGPRNHSKVGEGMIGSGKEGFLVNKSVAEHVSE